MIFDITIITKVAKNSLFSDIDQTRPFYDKNQQLCVEISDLDPLSE